MKGSLKSPRSYFRERILLTALSIKLILICFSSTKDLRFRIYAEDIISISEPAVMADFAALFKSFE